MCTRTNSLDPSAHINLSVRMRAECTGTRWSAPGMSASVSFDHVMQVVQCTFSSVLA